jgi:AcrR family transcriptional regulator
MIQKPLGAFEMNREEKSQDLVKTIIDVTRELFLSQGYRKTTIRQIIDKVGINTGSLYHYFKDKEDIFLHITRQTYNDFITYVDSMTEGDDVSVKYALTRALEFKLVEDYDRIAELYLEAYSSWRIGGMVQPINMKRNKDFFHQYNPDFTEEDYHNRTLAMRGMRLIFISERVHSGPGKFDSWCPFLIETALNVFNVPKQNIDNAIAKAMEMVKSDKCIINPIIKDTK